MDADLLDKLIAEAVDLRDDGDAPGAIRTLTEIVERAAGVPDADQQLAMAAGHLAATYMHVGQWSDAREVLERLIDRQADFSAAIQTQKAFALYNLGSCLREQGELEAAQQHLEEADRFIECAEVPNDERATIDELHVDVLHLEADILIDLGDDDHAMQLFERIRPRLKRDSPSPVRVATARALKERARKILAVDGLAAVSAADEIIAAYDADPDPAVRHAVASVMGYKAYFFECGQRWEAALSVYDQVLCQYGNPPTRRRSCSSTRSRRE